MKVWASPANITDSCPRSIFAYSSGPAERSFLIGQQGHAFAALLRTTTTAIDGTPVTASAPVNHAAPVHLVSTRPANLYRAAVYCRDLSATEVLRNYVAGP